MKNKWGFAFVAVLAAWGPCAPSSHSTKDGGSPDRAAATLSVDPSATVNSLKATRVTWNDSLGQPRSAALVQTPQSESKGGFVEQFTYRLANGETRTVNGASGSTGGFGYIVSHLQDPSRAGGLDDSPLGSTKANGSRILWAGPHHAIFEYKLDYPRWGRRAEVNREFDMPVIVHWVFFSGRNAPLWSATLDLSSASDGEVVADTRAPYGEMEFTGSSESRIGGVAWCDSHCFYSKGDPLTLSSGWDWLNPNSGAPYNLLYAHGVDAEMGIVATRVISRADAGGYQGADGFRRFSSATRSCVAQGYTMPCDRQWSFQSVNYSFYGANGTLAKNQPTSSKRLAWGSDWGYLGQSRYRSINANNEAIPGDFPRRSYSVYIVMDPHSANPTSTLAAQMRTIDQTIFTVRSGGALRSNGPAGIGRTDLVSYAPDGYNHVYGTWDVDLSSTSAKVSFKVPAGEQLIRPTLVFHQYDGSEPPGMVTLNELQLRNGTNLFASVRNAEHELWLTIGTDMTGDSTVEIRP